MGEGIIGVALVAMLSGLVVIVWAFKGAGSVRRRIAGAFMFFFLLGAGAMALAFSSFMPVWLSNTAFAFIVSVLLSGFVFPAVFNSAPLHAK